jgi:hypothetical protein
LTLTTVPEKKERLKKKNTQSSSILTVHRPAATVISLPDRRIHRSFFEGTRRYPLRSYYWTGLLMLDLVSHWELGKFNGSRTTEIYSLPHYNLSCTVLTSTSGWAVLMWNNYENYPRYTIENALEIDKF